MLYSGQTSDGAGDFISFGMRDRQAEFRLDVGSGPAVLTSGPLQLDRWYTARVRRDRKDGTLYTTSASSKGARGGSPLALSSVPALS